MKRYEGLFVLRTASPEDGAKDVIDKITAEINAAGGKVETTQKMDKRNFARVANKKHSAGFYVNIIFEAPPQAIPTLRNRFAMSEDVFRILFTAAPPVPAAPVPAK